MRIPANFADIFIEHRKRLFCSDVWGFFANTGQMTDEHARALENIQNGVPSHNILLTIPA